MTPEFDVAIVGGGPAGTSTALHLVRREGIVPARVLVLEKARHPRDKPCAGAISAWGVDALAALGIPLDVPHVVLRGLRVFAGADSGEHTSDLGVVVRRSEFDARLWARAREAGVATRDDEPLLDLARSARGWKLTTQRGDTSARIVVACDGAGSTVRKRLGVSEAARKGHLYVTETRPLPGDEGPRSRLCDFDLRAADAGIEGYYWDFPTVIGGEHAVSRGIYHANFTPRPDLKQHLARALESRGLGLGDVRLKAFSTRPFVPASSLLVSSLALVGEAAGIDATTGEGIAQAILAGGIAATHVAHALRRGDGALQGYDRAFRQSRVGRHLLQSAWLAERVYGPGGGLWRAFLARDAGARAAGARWYTGRKLGFPTKARLAASLAASLLGGLSPPAARLR